MPNDDVCLDKNFIESLFFFVPSNYKKNVNVWYTSRVFLHTNYSIPKKKIMGDVRCQSSLQG